MTIDELLSRLEGVRQRGARYVAKCPAHADRTPSLSISEGDRGILIKCWTGCRVEEICGSLGITPRELFFETSPLQRRSPRSAKMDRRAIAFVYELAALDLRLRACRVAEAGKGLDVATLSDVDLDRAMNYMRRAYVDVERAEMFEHIADGLRTRELLERKRGTQRLA